MRRVGDVMITKVITARPSTPFKQLVELLAVPLTLLVAAMIAEVFP